MLRNISRTPLILSTIRSKCWDQLE